jgi:hypothetical protein
MAMKARPMQLVALALISGTLLGCPDTGAPKLPTTPNVPQPKAGDALSHLALAPSVHLSVRETM